MNKNLKEACELYVSEQGPGGRLIAETLNTLSMLDPLSDGAYELELLVASLTDPEATASVDCDRQGEVLVAHDGSRAVLRLAPGEEWGWEPGPGGWPGWEPPKVDWLNM